MANVQLYFKPNILLIFLFKGGILKVKWNSKTMQIVFLLVFTLLNFQFCFSQNNKCSFSNVHLLTKQSFKIDILLENEDTLAGFQLPLLYEFGDNEITCDSVSFVGSKCKDFDFLQVKIDNEMKVLYLSGIARVSVGAKVENLAPGKQVIATMYFSNLKYKEKCDLKFHANIFPDSTRDYILTAWDPRGDEVRFSVEFNPISF